MDKIWRDLKPFVICVVIAVVAYKLGMYLLYAAQNLAMDPGIGTLIMIGVGFFAYRKWFAKNRFKAPTKTK